MNSKKDRDGLARNAGTIDQDAVAQLPLLGIVLFSAWCVDSVRHALWGAERKTGEWVTAVNEAIHLAKEVAAAPERAASRKFQKESKQLFNIAEEFAFEARLDDDPPAKHVMVATFHLTAGMMKVGEIATLYKKGKPNETAGKAQLVVRATAEVIGAVLLAVPAGRAENLLADVRKALETGRQATAARNEEEQRLHVLQPVSLKDFGIPEGDGRITGSLSESPTPSLLAPDPHDLLREMDADYLALRERTRGTLQALLNRLEGIDFPTLEAKQEIASRIAQVLRRTELRIKCPECGEPAMLRAAAAGTSRNGVFQFDHSSGKARSTHRGAGKLPGDLEVVDAHPDKRLKTFPSPSSKPAAAS